MKDLEQNEPARQRSGLPHSTHRQDDYSPESSTSAIDQSRRRSGFKRRIKHFSWTWFTMSMATGGMANVIYSIPFRFNGLFAIGCIFFFLNIAMFGLDVLFISFRFLFFRENFKASFLDPTESLYVPASVVSLGTLLINISQYGLGRTGPWLENTMTVLFWIDCAVAIISSCGIYLTLWSTQTFMVSRMTPIWIFPAYPLLLIAPYAAVLSSVLPPTRALQVIIGGVILQGIGFMVSLMIYSAYIYRLMTHKLPRENLRPGMFVSVGPSGFTITGFIGMAGSIQRAVPGEFMGDGKMTGMILKIMGNWIGIWLWGLALWFFFISVFAHSSCVRTGGLHFDMTWFSFIFPNTALVTATLAVGKAFDLKAIQVIGTTMAVMLTAVWIFVMVMMGRSIWKKQLLWPQDEKEEEENPPPASSVGPSVG